MNPSPDETHRHEPAPPRQDALFRAGEGGYHTYRIPALIPSAEGTLLAFCEGRRESSSDTGFIETLLRRSHDGGETWSPPQVVASDPPHTFGNPCPVVDRDTGVIHLLLTRNLGHDWLGPIVDGTSEGTREVWVTRSEDDGATWSPPVEITAAVKPPDWTWYATGPGVGIQLRGGRLVIPCDHAVAETKVMRSHVIYSDDGGATWRLGGVAGDNCNECQVVELDDGALLLNMRSYHGKNRRAVSVSRDGGLTWSAPVFDEALIEPVCQAGLIRHTLPSGETCLVFTNPASVERERMTVRLSFDGGATWPHEGVLHEGPAAYSCPASLPGGGLACLYERGDEHAYETLTLARFEAEWVRGRGGDAAAGIGKRRS